MTPVTVDEQMVWSLACQTRADDVVVVGVATPMALIAALLARHLLHPELTIIAAATFDPRLHDVAGPMLAPGMLNDLGVGTLSQTEILDQIQRGRVTLQFVSPAQVDGRGRLNTSRVRAGDGSVRILPGGLATGDIAVLIGRLIAYRATHSTRFLPRDVTFVTGAGHDPTAPEWRRNRRLPGSGVTAVVTSRAILRWNEAGDTVYLESIHGGAAVDEVIAGCGFRLEINPPIVQSEVPPPDAIDLLRKVVDPLGTRRLEVKATRREALEELERQRR